jgi:single-strand DNA-binding protein
MLRVSLLGNLGADPEARFSQKGTSITQFRVAVNQVRTGPDGERQENTEWFRIRATGRLGEFAQRLTKGTRVVVEGRLDIQHYQTREGEPRVGFDVWADEVVNVSGRPMGGDGGEHMDLEPMGSTVGAPGASGPGASGGSLVGAGAGALGSGAVGASVVGANGAGVSGASRGNGAASAPPAGGSGSGGRGKTASARGQPSPEELEDLPF